MIRLVLALCLFACANAREARTPEQTKAEQDAAGTAQEPLPPSTQASNLSPIAKSWLEQVKNAFGNPWTKAVIAASQRTDPTGCIYSTQDRRTVVCFRVAAGSRLTQFWREVPGSGGDRISRRRQEAQPSAARASTPRIADGIHPAGYEGEALSSSTLDRQNLGVGRKLAGPAYQPLVRAITRCYVVSLRSICRTSVP